MMAMTTAADSDIPYLIQRGAAYLVVSKSFQVGSTSYTRVDSLAPQFHLAFWLEDLYRYPIFSMATSGVDTISTTESAFLFSKRFVSNPPGFSMDDLFDFTREATSSPCLRLDEITLGKVYAYVAGVVQEAETTHGWSRMGKLMFEVTVQRVLDLAQDERLSASWASCRNRRGRVENIVIDQKALKERVWEEYCGGEGGGCTSTCTVCCEEFRAGETVAQMPCSHCFHKKCVNKWLMRGKRSCPNCRSTVQ